MKVRSKAIRIFLFMIAIGTVRWAYLAYDRQREIRDFFKDPGDLAWGRTYLDKKINYCDAPWQMTVVHKIGDKEEYRSPTGHFKLNIYTTEDYRESFDLIDLKAKVSLLTYRFRWGPKGAGLGYDDLKWARNERFLIFRKPITMDSDWATSRIYVCDTTNGEVIYLGDSKFYECEMRNW